MSLSKSKSFLTGVLLAILFAMAGSAMALEGARLWKPYQPEDFGGKRRDRDGVYASLEAIYWTISAPKGAYIGATTPNGQNEVRDYFSGTAIRQQTNSMNASNFESTFKAGTRVEIGNRRGHHGWLFSGFGLPSTGSTITAENVNMVIRDEGDITLRPGDTVGTGGGLTSGYFNNGSVVTVWDPSASFGSQLAGASIKGDSTINNVGMLWGWFPIHYDPGPIFTEAILAPVPITFHSMEVTNKTENWGIELNYTYRTHPFKWGGLELLAGARYWEFDDHFNILGSGPLSTTRQEIEDDSIEEETLYPFPNVNAMGPVSLLSTLNVEARGLNRVIGPQIGAKFKRQNGRWTLGSEIRFMAGINNQNMRTKGYLGKNLAFNMDMGYYSTWNLGNVDDGDEESAAYPGGHTDSTILDQMWQQGVYPWLPVGMTGTGNYYSHKLNKTYFTPIVEWRIDADWQWTDAVSFNVGFNTTFADNIARAYRMTDYKISNTEVFGIRGSRNTSVLVYGVSFGLKMKR